MASMSLKKSNINILLKHQMVKKLCWGCEKQVMVMFRDKTTGGYLCRKCMPDVYWADRVLSGIKGVRGPEDGEFTDLDNN